MENKEEEPQKISQKQLVLIDKLIQSSKFTKTERDYIVDKTKGRLITTYDGKILIEHLLGKINFEKCFNGNKTYKKAKCQWCGNKVGLKRYSDKTIINRIWLCEDCSKRAGDYGFFLASWKKEKEELEPEENYHEEVTGEDIDRDHDRMEDDDVDLDEEFNEDPNGERQEEFCN